MKKLMLATLALAAFATTSNAQLAPNQINNSTTTGVATDQSTISLTVVVPNVLTLSPNSASLSVTLTQAQTMAGAGNYYAIGSNTWTVWSNREYFVYYNTDQSNLHFSNSTGALDDGDESETMPVGAIQMRVSGNGTGGNNLMSNYTNLVHATTVAHNSEFAHGTAGDPQTSWGNGTEIIDEGQAGNRNFTTDFQIQSPGYNYVGGTYSATVYIWAIQE